MDNLANSAIITAVIFEAANENVDNFNEYPYSRLSDHNNENDSAFLNSTIFTSLHPAND
jgi:hypothetical protein